MITGVEFYDNNAADYIRSKAEYHRQRFDIFNRLLPAPPGAVFDFGCGSAENLVTLAHRGFSIAGVDPAPRLIEQGKALLTEHHLDADAVRVGGLAEFERLDAGSVDVVTSVNVLPYLTQEEEDRFFRAAQRVVKHGGAVVFSVGNALSDLVTLNRYTVEFYDRHVLPLLSDSEAERRELSQRLAALLANAHLPPRRTDTSYADRGSSERDVVPTRRVILTDFMRRLHDVFGLAVDTFNFFHFWPLPPQLLEHDARLMSLKYRFGERASEHPLGVVFASQINVRVRI